MVTEADFEKYSFDIRRQPRPPIGLTLLDTALKLPGVSLIRSKESSIDQKYSAFKRDTNLIYSKGTLLAKDRKTGLVRLLTRQWAEFEGIAGFCEANFEPDESRVWSRGAVVLNIEGAREFDRRKKVYALDFNTFTLDESAGGFHIGYVKYSQQYGRACVVFAAMKEEPITTADLRLSGYADVRV